MKEKSCCFFGHAELNIDQALIDKITNFIKGLLLQDYKVFYFGGFGMFDEICYQIVCKLKQEHSDIKRIFCVVEEQQLNSWKRPNWLNQRQYEDFIYFSPEFDYWYKRIYYRNIEMIKNSDLSVFFVEHDYGGAYKVMQYATKNKVNTINLAK